MKFTQKVLIIAIIILIIIGIPIALELFIFDNIIISNVSNDGWAGFFGCYIGAISGALTTLIAVSIQMKENEKNRRKDEISNVRPYLIINVTSLVTNEGQTKIQGEIRNIGLHSACDIYIYEDDMDHPDNNEIFTQHLSICANEREKIEINFDFNKSVYYKFSFYDLKSNMYEQELRFDTTIKNFYSLEPYVTRYAD